MSGRRTSNERGEIRLLQALATLNVRFFPNSEVTPFASWRLSLQKSPNQLINLGVKGQSHDRQAARLFNRCFTALNMATPVTGIGIPIAFGLKTTPGLKARLRVTRNTCLIGWINELGQAGCAESSDRSPSLYKCAQS